MCVKISCLTQAAVVAHGLSLKIVQPIVAHEYQTRDDSDASGLIDESQRGNFAKANSSCSLLH